MAPIRFAVIIALLLGATAQAVAAAERPRVGLVLSGGGARGAAHVGALKALEAQRIPVDVVVGTSMGATIGGLYAAGLSPGEIEQSVRNIDWQAVFRDRPARQDLSFQRKQDELLFPVKVEIGYGNGRFLFPKGLLAGQQLQMLLERLTLRSATIRDFDQLPLPFRAVATDIETGDMVVLARGDLPSALRASMSVPGAFAPVGLEGRLLVDGGLVRNLPIDVARALGAEVVILIDVGAPLQGRGALESVVGVSTQVLRMTTIDNTRAQLATLTGRDVLIAPALRDMGSSDFERSGDAIDLGEVAVQQAQGALAQLAVDEAAWQRHLERQRRAPLESLRPEFILLDNQSRVSAEFIRRKLGVRPGEPLAISRLQENMNRLYGTGDFETVSMAVTEQEGREGLRFRLRQKSWGPNYLRFGLKLSDDFEGDSSYDLLGRYTATRLNALGGESRNLLQIGQTRRLSSEFYQPLDYDGEFFIAPRLELARDRFDSYTGKSRTAQYHTRTSSLGLDGGMQVRNWGEWRVGLVRSTIVAGPRVGASSLPEYDIQQGALRMRFSYDQLDSLSFPRRGTFAGLEWFSARDTLGADVSYDKLSLRATQALSFGPHTVLGGVRLGGTLRSRLPFYDEFALGGFLALSGLHRDQIKGQHMALGSLLYYRRVRGPASLRFADALYFGGSLETGNVWNDWGDIDTHGLRLSGSLLFGADTVIGPLYLGFGATDRGDSAGYLYLGHTF